MKDVHAPSTSPAALQTTKNKTFNINHQNYNNDIKFYVSDNNNNYNSDPKGV